MYAGRYTTAVDHDFVLFLIGARIPLRHLAKAGWIAKAFGDMMKTLQEHPEKGYLGGESFMRFFPLTNINVMYWRSYDHLERFAHDKTDPHLEAWRQFNQRVGRDGTIGIWHEAYQIKVGQYEALYGNMPRFGLGKAGRHIPVTGKLNTGRDRMRAVVQEHLSDE